MFKLKMFITAIGTFAGLMLAGAFFFASWWSGASAPLAFLGLIGTLIGTGSLTLGGISLRSEIRDYEEWRWRETVKAARAAQEEAETALLDRPVPALPGDIDALFAAQDEAVQELARECATRCQSLIDQQRTMRGRMSGLAENVEHINQDRDRLRKIAQRAARARAAFDADELAEGDYGFTREKVSSFPGFLRTVAKPSIEEDISAVVNGSAPPRGSDRHDEAERDGAERDHRPGPRREA